MEKLILCFCRSCSSSASSRSGDHPWILKQSGLKALVRFCIPFNVKLRKFRFCLFLKNHLYIFFGNFGKLLKWLWFRNFSFFIKHLRYLKKKVILITKSRIRETPTLSTCVDNRLYAATSPGEGAGVWPMSGRDLIMQSEGQWVASKTFNLNNKKRHMKRHTYGHRNLQTHLAQSSRFGENLPKKLKL